MGKNQNNIIVGLDIGTTKVCAIVGQRTNGSTNVIGIGTYPSEGLRKGVVVNIESTVNSLRKAIEEAELMAGSEIHSVCTGISGSHIKGFNSLGVIAIKNREVKNNDVRRVIDAAKAIAIPIDREVIHILPQEFIVDDQDGIKEPVGMIGVRLETRVHIVTGATNMKQNIIKCADRIGLNISDIVLEQLASSKATLSADEKELGVILLDIGGGTTDIAIFSKRKLKHTSVLSLGGDYVTSDIAVGLRTPMNEAEKIKKKYGCAFPELVNRDETIEVPSVGGRAPRILPRIQLCEIIEPRMEEIFSLVKRELIKSNCDGLMASGIVITGGSALLEGLPELGESVFNLPVRVGYPMGIEGLSDVVNNPMYSTGVGLLLYGSNGLNTNEFKQKDKNILGRASNRFKQWFEEAFL
ncbi:MAG: cell division protein FtsA [Thermodesulfobacteriota bacterium]|nr:cell division protein FtsA [Thermodesulfobacteriota bacterium]